MTTLQPPALPALAAGVLVATLLSAALRSITTRTAQPTDGRDTVACPACDTENDADYRYCRACVAELPGGRVHERRGAPASGRLLR